MRQRIIQSEFDANDYGNNDIQNWLNGLIGRHVWNDDDVVINIEHFTITSYVGKGYSDSPNMRTIDENRFLVVVLCEVKDALLEEIEIAWHTGKLSYGLDEGSQDATIQET